MSAITIAKLKPNRFAANTTDCRYRKNQSAGRINAVLDSSCKKFSNGSASTSASFERWIFDICVPWNEKKMRIGSSVSLDSVGMTKIDTKGSLQKHDAF